MMIEYASFTLPRPVPSALKPIYGETTTYATLLRIHGGTLLLTALLAWLFRAAPLLQNAENKQVAMWLLWDLAGGSLAHLTRSNHRYWARLPVEMRLLALASMAWQPLVLVLVFQQPALLLPALHLLAGLLYWLVQRVPLYVTLLITLAILFLLLHLLPLPPPIALLTLLYLLKVVLAYRPEQEETHPLSPPVAIP